MAHSWISCLTLVAIAIIATAIGLYLFRLNCLLKSTPNEIQNLSGPRWTSELLLESYKELDKSAIDYTEHIPPRLHRRYIVTGGAGLVGGYIVLQLLARGTPPINIRIIDIRKTERNDMLTDLATQIDFVQADITDAALVDAAFYKPWNPSVAHLPLTVFHTAAVIIPSERSKHLYGFPEAVNIRGTKYVLAASRKAGADIFSSTSSASISIRPVEAFVAPWASEPKHFWQILDDRDFFYPLRPHEDFFGNYPASKATAERLVCAENDESFRTGCIRPANGVYGNPTDNTVGRPLSKETLPTWIPHVVQSFVHGANVAIAHLHHESVLLNKQCPQGGRPFVVTDPNPPISYGDLYNAIKTLSIHPFRVIVLPPVLMLLMSHAIEWYILLPYRYPLLKRFLPEIKGEVKYLQPGLFSICTHLVASDTDARKPVNEGGLGYRGVLTTLQGMVLEVLEWNREHSRDGSESKKRAYTTSVTLAEKIQQLGAVGSTVKV